jgi:hypothetical protein
VSRPGSHGVAGPVRPGPPGWAPVTPVGATSDAADQDKAMRLFLDGQRLLRVADEHRHAYASAQPYPHVVLDGLFPDDALDHVLAEFPDPDSPVWKAYRNYHEQKLEAQGEERLGEATSLLLYQFNSAPFLRFLERLTGIEHLIPDPYFQGGGLHQILRGGKLGVHADFSTHKVLPLHRRLNVLIYLNRDWHADYGGALELWDNQRARCVERIVPIFNRMVVFTITDWAYHGHPEPLTCPDGMTRKSIALFYFTVKRPPGEVMQGKRSTLFIQRPGEVVPPGTVFSRDAWSAGPPGRGAIVKHVARRVTPPVLFDAVRSLRNRARP